jgi:AbrB family looped-hinge helix DNA binding protein
MNKVLQATSQGQITIPKKWRDKFDTNVYMAEIKDDVIIIKPIESNLKKGFKEELDAAWQEYLDGNYITHQELTKKHGI